ncbi:MAG: hypothetical protein JSV88_29300 [Candidatus Aminicenantes bacterium]|nr:MAG: hypothetical protein JSV88_29300 [Candidatus Aminicenantes bacterium]
MTKEKTRGKHFLIKVSGIVFLIVLVVVYFLLYFIPTVKSINRCKRQLKDLNLKISDFVKAENTFSFSDEQEKNYFVQAEQELKGKIPAVKSQEDSIALFTKICNDIQKLADKDGVSNLVLKSGSQDLSPLASLVENIKYHTLTLSFTGELKNAMNFINHIPWSDYYLMEDKIFVCTGDILPYYIVLLRVYYIDLEEQKGRKKNDAHPIIDYNSEILLKPLHPELVEPYPRSELSPEFGIKIFSKHIH